MTVSFAANETSKSVAIPILSDALVEGSESFNVTLSNPTNGGTLAAQRRAVVIITDDDSARTLQFSATSFTVAENASGGVATITVTRTGGSAGTVSVSYATRNNTARTGSDYTSASGTLSFAAGETSKRFSVAIANDSLAEGTESLNVMLSNPAGGATLGNGRQAMLLITDND